MPGCESRHLPRAYEEDLPSRERVEDLPPEGDGRITHRDRVLGDTGFRAHAFGDGERFFEDPGQAVLTRAGFLRDPVGFLHLPENLGLSEHHRVERRCHSKQMVDGPFAPLEVKMVCELVGRQAGELLQMDLERLRQNVRFG